MTGLLTPARYSPRKQDLIRLDNGLDCGTSTINFYASALNMNPSSTAHTKGSWYELISAANNTVNTVAVYMSFVAGCADANSNLWMTDIGIGGSGSEVAIIPNIVMSVPQLYGQDFLSLTIPLSIPSGTRISTRSQTDGPNIAPNGGVSLRLLPAAEGQQLSGISGYDNIGANTSSTSGIVITPGVGPSKSSWVELEDSTTKDYEGFVVCFDDQAIIGNGYPAFIDIGIGAASSEEVLVPNLVVFRNAYNQFPSSMGFFPYTRYHRGLEYLLGHLSKMLPRIWEYPF